MDVLILLVVMVIVGAVIGAIAGVIWKDDRPIGIAGDYIAAILATVIIGLMDWFVIPAMNFSNTIKYLGVAIEPALGALIVLWIIRKAKSD
jgi:uncharacterized membrane protein YeaQ/YmgE (transglycosylase-associated protein family)